MWHVSAFGKIHWFSADEEDEVILNVECHYGQANVDGCIFSIGDCAFIRVDH